MRKKLCAIFAALTICLFIAVPAYAVSRRPNVELMHVIYGSGKNGYFQHFITSGMAEGRQGSKSFNLSVYKANNPDLVAQFGDDNVKYYQHYMQSGKAEGRKAS